MRNEVRVFVFLLLSCLWTITMSGPLKNIYGYVEHVVLIEKDLKLPAKLDTGAKSASLNAVDIKEVKEGEQLYLTFIVPSKAGDIKFKAPYIGDVKIKLRDAEKLNPGPLVKNYHPRPVVLMKVRLGEIERTIKVNLTNRKRFIYPLLLGRDAINAFNGVVDPTQKYVLESDGA